MILEWRSERPEDRHFVLSSWMRSFEKGGDEARCYADRRRYFEDHQPVVKDILARSSVLVACLPDASDVVVGWMCVEAETLHYIQVKPRFRRSGVASWMLEQFRNVALSYSHRTRDFGRFAMTFLPPGAPWTYRPLRKYSERARESKMHECERGRQDPIVSLEASYDEAG